MPRKKPRTLTVVGCSPMQPGKAYPFQTGSIEIARDRRTLVVDLLHISQVHEGERQTLTIGLPLRPVGQGHEFFSALGLEVKEGAIVDLDQAVGRSLLVSFRQGPDSRLVPQEFQPMKESS